LLLSSSAAAALDFVIVVKNNLCKKTKGPFQTRGQFLSLSSSAAAAAAVAAALDLVVVVKSLQKNKGSLPNQGPFLKAVVEGNGYS